MTPVTIRREGAEDAPAIRAVHCAAFPTDEEARLVERLRAAGRASVSLVAELNDAEMNGAEPTRQVVGHIVFSPVTIVGASSKHQGLGLAPLAVLPAHQRSGIGSALVRAGLAACREAACPFVVVLGHPDYYARVGFSRASDFALQNEYGADEAFMVLELLQGSLPSAGGLVKYGPEFGAWAK